MNNIKKNLKIILLIVTILIIFILLYLKDKKTLTTNPLPGYRITTNNNSNSNENPRNESDYNNLKSITPQTGIEIGTKYIKFEFEKSVNPENFEVIISPNLKMLKMVSPSTPNVLTIYPDTIWGENVNYKLIIKSNTLKEDIIYNVKYIIKEART